MTPPRFRIRRLMVVIALIAVNLAVLRALFVTRRVDLLIGGSIVWVAFEVGVLRALRRPGRQRRFWLGYLGFGALATLSFLVAVWFPESWPASVWKGYLLRSNDLLEQLIMGSAQRYGYSLAHELLFVVGFALQWVLPLVLVAVAGGVLTRRALNRFDCPTQMPAGPSTA